jgi:diacylglycerol kinase (ATP)
LDHLVFIINSRSGRKKNERLKTKIREIIRAYPVNAHIYLTQKAAECKDIVQDHIQNRNSFFIAVGGDGTLNTIARELIGTSTSLAIIPRGSGNGLARHLRMPRNLSAAIQRILNKRSMLTDAILINDQWAFNVAGIGFDGHISTLFGANGQRGMRNYMKLIQSEYRGFKPCHMKLSHSQQSFEANLFQLAIANASQYGNNAVVAPTASISDGLLDIAMIRKVPIPLLPAFFLKVFAGQIHKSRYVTSFQTAALKIQTERPMDFHTDGDGKGMACEFEIHIRPDCLRLIY